jgi:hypothetical protein
VWAIGVTWVIRVIRLTIFIKTYMVVESQGEQKAYPRKRKSDWEAKSYSEEKVRLGGKVILGRES